MRYSSPNKEVVRLNVLQNGESRDQAKKDDKRKDNQLQEINERDVISGLHLASPALVRAVAGVCNSPSRATRCRRDRALNVLKCATPAMVLPLRRCHEDLQKILEHEHQPFDRSAPSTQYLQACDRSQTSANANAYGKSRFRCLPVVHRVEVGLLLHANGHQPVPVTPGDNRFVGFVSSKSSTDPTEPKTRTSPPLFLRTPATVP